MALPDAEILHNASALFCACDAGQALLSMVARRNADFMQWLKTTETAQREAAARIAAGAFGMAGIPDRFRNATWGAMRNRCDKDPGKKEALLLTYRLLQDGYIERHGVRKKSLLLLDELGHNWRDDATAHTVEVLHSVLFYRHAYDMPTIFTSNKSPDELATMFGEEHWQRIGEMAVIIEMSGETLRELG